jgi:hypothetical protein
MPKAKEVIKPIGGFYDLQLPSGNEYYADLLRLNTGRNALEYILRQKAYSKIYIPFFTCDVLLEPIKKLGVKYEFYSINERLEPIINFEIEPTACLLYTNYFGIKHDAVITLSEQIPNIIIDNSQAFYSEPLPGVDTFYSCRKFFGVPDGAYLSIQKKLNKKLPIDVSYNRVSHLTKSIDLGIEAAYADSLTNNKLLENNEIKIMSNLTKRIMSSIRYDECAQIRERNFFFLHQHLKEFNLFQFDFPTNKSPMVYPFLYDDRNLKIHLIQQKIFVATYWPNVYNWTNTNMYENYLTTNLVPLPIDHRYNLKDMFYMLNTLKQVL